MSWGPHLRVEIALEFRALAEWQRRGFFEVYDHHQVKLEERRKLGPTAQRARYDAERQASSSRLNLEVARAAGDIRRVRFLESTARAAKRRRS